MKPITTFATIAVLFAGTALAADNETTSSPDKPAMAADASTPDLAMKAKAAAKADWFFKKIDTDGDGKISKAEHQAFSDKMFDEADTDRDGFLTHEELSTAKKKEMEQWRAQHKS